MYHFIFLRFKDFSKKTHSHLHENSYLAYSKQFLKVKLLLNFNSYYPTYEYLL